MKVPQRPLELNISNWIYFLSFLSQSSYYIHLCQWKAWKCTLNFRHHLGPPYIFCCIINDKSCQFYLLCSFLVCWFMYLFIYGQSNSTGNTTSSWVREMWNWIPFLPFTNYMKYLITLRFRFSVLFVWDSNSSYLSHGWSMICYHTKCL